MSSLRSFTLAVATIGVCLFCHNACAQSVPLKASGNDAAYTPATGDYSGFGNGTHLGNHFIDGNVIPDGVFFPAEGVFFAGTFAGSQVSIAANGDVLEAELQGEVLLVFNEVGLVEGMWYPSFVITGGTGRFANASGSFDGVAINPPFDPFSETWGFNWSFDGKMDLGKKK